MSILSKKTNQQQQTVTLLDSGCEFQGKLSFEGVVHIDGVFQGEIFSHDHLIVGKGAVVEANIQVGELELGGTFTGDIICQNKLTVHATGRISGNIKAKVLEVHPGAIIDGNMEMVGMAEAGIEKGQEKIVHFQETSHEHEV